MILLRIMQSPFLHFNYTSVLQLWRDASEVPRSSAFVRAVGVRLAGSGFVDTVIAVSMTYFVS